MLQKTTIISLCLLFGLGVRAQTPEVKFDHLSVEHGLSQSTGSAIMQDSNGFMWFGTQDGLNKYDGLVFTTYRNNPDDAATIANNNIGALQEAADGTIWVGLEGGELDRFDPGSEVFMHYGDKLLQPPGTKGNMVVEICKDASDVLWFATAAGLAQYREATDGFHYFFVDTVNSEQNFISAILQDAQQRFWVGTRAGRVFRFDKESGQFKEQQVGAGSDLGFITAIHQDRSDLIWIVAEGTGVVRYDPESGDTKRFSHEPAGPQTISGNNVSSIAEDHQGNLWIGTYGNGLNRLNRASGRVSRYANDVFEPNSLSNDFVYSLFCDRSGTLWIGTAGGGVNKYDPAKTKFAHYKNDLRNPEVLRGNFVWSIFEDSRGYLWIGTQNGGLNLFDPQRSIAKVFTHDPEDAKTLSANSVFAICEDLSGNIWVGTSGRGLNKLDRSTGDITRYSGNPRNQHGLLNNSIRNLLVDDSGIIWIGTIGGGLHRFDPVADEFEYYLHDPDDATSISNNSIIALCEDSRGLLWLGTGNGLNKLDKKTGKFTRYFRKSGEAGTLSNDYVMSVCEDPAGNIWVGTYYGLNRLEVESGKFTTYTTRHGLPNDVIYGVLADDNGHIWASSNRGLSRYDPGTETFRNFDPDDGLQSYEFNSGAYFKNSAGRMYFGGVNGFNVFHPDSIYDDPNPPPLVITAVKRFDKEVDFESPREPIQFSYEDNFITFEFAALDYTNPEKNQYAYKLEGLHDQWIYCKNQNYATFTNLPHGQYTFQVKGSNNDGVWNETGASLRFVVTPPFWRSWWFRWLSVALALAGSIALIRYYHNKQRQRAELDRKFSELKLQALRAQMNPHFIFNTLNSIQYYISNNEQKHAYQYLSKFSRLMRKILDNSEKSTLTIAEELEALQLYLELEALRFEGKFTYKLEVDPGIDVHNLEIPTLLIQPFVENAIQHGLRYKRTNGALDISLQLDGDVLVCSIQDNGIGIEKAREKRAQDGQHRPAGLKVTQERLETMNALRRNGRSVEIVDLSKENGNMTGTRVKIMIPLET